MRAKAPLRNSLTTFPRDSNSSTGVYTPVIVAFLTGCVVGSLMSIFRADNFFVGKSTALQHPTQFSSTVSRVIRLQDVPFKSTSHRDRNGAPILKKQLIEPFVVVPTLAGISVATLQANQTIPMHSHDSMHEFFLVWKGTGSVQVEDTQWALEPGSFVHVPPNQRHAFEAISPLSMQVVGVTTT